MLLKAGCCLDCTFSLLVTPPVFLPPEEHLCGSATSPPRVKLSDLNGSAVRIPDDFRGKVIILHFWAGGCSSCKEEMPAMEKLYEKYGRKGLVILAVNVGQRKEFVKRLVKDAGNHLSGTPRPGPENGRKL